MTGEGAQKKEVARLIIFAIMNSFVPRPYKMGPFAISTRKGGSTEHQAARSRAREVKVRQGLMNEGNINEKTIPRRDNRGFDAHAHRSSGVAGRQLGTTTEAACSPRSMYLPEVQAICYEGMEAL